MGWSPNSRVYVRWYRCEAACVDALDRDGEVRMGFVWLMGDILKQDPPLETLEDGP